MGGPVADRTHLPPTQNHALVPQQGQSRALGGFGAQQHRQDGQPPGHAVQ
ncbi:predicted protein [Streptomyces viridosporus ATCC 14672]|uniref:Predicted protein n=1 Tax=Streptomyces viridosporus (strain ATCC 14672 / DSM 40746 / JCM 4963 / KCTC 9882 / NRRL B-12104 / FH 1290) TaxID=566461 RepID=D6A5H8_STRV1|nr:predicted protein [Streptomyces viridosporus ATCC 14672]